MGSGELTDHLDLLRRSDVEGVQVVYNWRSLEPRTGVYDFSRVEADLERVEELGKDFFLQLQDRFFSPEARRVPDYLLEDPLYDGGLARQYDNPGEGKPVAQGWAAKQWNPAVRERFQALLLALAERFDGRIYGLNLPESAVDVIEGGDGSGFDCDAYFAAELENAAFARRVFERSHVVQYVNFWPCEWNDDRGYMSKIFARAVALGFGLGGPDVVPHRRAHMKNAYPFFHRHSEDLALVAMAIQEPTLTYTDPETGEPFTREALVAFARDYLGVDVLFWSTSAGWLGDGRPARSADYMLSLAWTIPTSISSTTCLFRAVLTSSASSIR